MIIRTIRLFSTHHRRRAVFLGSPKFAAESLQTLHAKAGLYGFDLVAVVTQPSCSINGATPVEKLSRKLGVSEILTPVTPKDEEFLARMRDLSPDICLTAAYGGFLPRAFLEIPPLGVFNIHPSLLPQYRGAAPVQRCLEDGHTETGVTVLKTVLAMDAGPVVDARRVSLTGAETADELTADLFRLGTQMFLDACPAIFKGTIVFRPQDEGGVSKAHKLVPEESLVDFHTMSAVRIYNRYRAFSEKPGIKAVFFRKPATNRKKQQQHSSQGVEEARLMAEDYAPFEVRLNAVGLLPALSDGDGAEHIESEGGSSGDRGRVAVRYVVPNPQSPHACFPEPLAVPYFEVRCGDGSRLAVLQLQPNTRRVMAAKEFHNGNRKEPFFV